ncbi:hypothetical protein HPB51_002051 [Rhipicephalus microplus]|uniref:Uncharacterized protein n=1 Tax=Rhipicephalus microplus TaxID=6941 RepID=A0A9J6DSE0_RHIMP|nr:hypothetical protein HPB51_002051 [Rhipicephalus microplus]
MQMLRRREFASAIKSNSPAVISRDCTTFSQEQEVARSLHFDNRNNALCTIRGHIAGRDSGPYRALVSTSRVHVLVNGSLSVRSLENGDAGLYLCEASNGVGAELSKVVRLTVRSSPRLSPKESTTSAKRASTVHLQCEPTGDTPMRFWWLKDGVPIAAIDVPGIPDNPQVTEASSRFVRLAWTEPFNGNMPITQYLLRWINKEDKTFADYTAESLRALALTSVFSWSLVSAARLNTFRTTFQKVLVISSARYATKAGERRETVRMPSAMDDSTRRDHASFLLEKSSACSTAVVGPPGSSSKSGDGRVDGYYVAYRRQGTSEPLRYHTLHECEGVLSGLDKDTRYEVLVQAFNAKGPGPPSGTHVVRTLAADPPPPPTYRVVGTSARTISLAWERPAIPLDDPPIRSKPTRCIIEKVAWFAGRMRSVFLETYFPDYYVSWRLEGDEHSWREQSVGGDRTSFSLSSLACAHEAPTAHALSQ